MPVRICGPQISGQVVWSLLVVPSAMPNGTAWAGQVGVATDPNSPGRIVIGFSWWWEFMETLDYGAGWVGGGTIWQTNSIHQQIATDIPWLQKTGGGIN